MTRERKPHGKTSDRAQNRPSKFAVGEVFDRLESALEDGDKETAEATILDLLQHPRVAADECERRLVNPRSTASTFLVELLRTLAGPQAETALRRVAEHRSSPDYIRFHAQRLTGWDTTDVAFQRVMFLDSLGDPLAALVEIATSAANTSFHAPDSIEEILRYLMAMPASRRMTFAAAMADSLGASFTMLGVALAHVDDYRLQEFVVAWLREHAGPDAIAPLQRVSLTAIDVGVRESALAAASHLTSRLPLASNIERYESPPAMSAMLSSVDSEGEQVVVLSRARAEGWMGYVQLFWDDTTGVRDIYGASYAPEDVLEDLREELDTEGAGVVDVSPAVVRGIFQKAIEVSARTGHPLPPAFELWEPFIHDARPVDAEETVEIAELDDVPYAGRDDLVATSTELFDHEWFTMWRFSMMDTMRGMSMADPPQGEQLTNAQYEPLIEALADPFRRHLLRSRLRRQAWALHQTGADRERDLALAVSASLRSIGATELVEHPFLRKMADLSVEMTDPLDGAGLGMPGGYGITDLFRGNAGGISDLSDAWLDELDAFDDEDGLDVTDLEDTDPDDPSRRLIEFPRRNEPRP